MRPQPLAACLALVVFLPFGGASATPQATPAAPAPPAPAAAVATPAAPTGNPSNG
ncbi:cytochrome C, partial [Xanthomonas perforans]